MTAIQDAGPSTIPDTILRGSIAAEQHRADVLNALALLPGTAHLTSKEAAIYIGTSADVLRVWRSTGRGPRFKGRGYFVRYVKSDLDKFMSGYDHRFERGTA